MRIAIVDESPARAAVIEEGLVASGLTDISILTDRSGLVAKLEALERERQVISADLHDDIGPLLSAALLKLSTVNPEGVREKNFLQQADAHIREIYTRIRELSVQMVPRAIEKKGPFYALDEFAESCLVGQLFYMAVSRDCEYLLKK